MTVGDDDVLEDLADLVSHVGPSPPAGSLEPLPGLHQALLRRFNGFTLYHGAYRLFGIGRDPPLDLATHNDHETWRFAWDDRIAPFLCFGASAWGDQYAYRRSLDGELEEAVYLLDASDMEPEVIEPSFDEFVRKELIRIGHQPYDSMTLEAVRQLGEIDPGNQWVFTPSLLLGGDEDIGNVSQLPVSVAMTFAGDIATAVSQVSEEAWPTAVIPWSDEQGRPRLRIEFDTDSA